MIVTCNQCGARYDDARCSTICPHDPFLTVQQAARKDLAGSLVGKELRFIVDASTSPRRHRIQSIAWDGMVSLSDETYGGYYFDPALFVIADGKEQNG